MHFCVHRYLGVAGARVQTSVRLATERTLSFFREKIRGRQEKDPEIEDGVAEDGQQQRSGSQVDQGEPRAQKGGEDDSANTLIAVAEAEGAGLQEEGGDHGEAPIADQVVEQVSPIECFFANGRGERNGDEEPSLGRSGGQKEAEPSHGLLNHGPVLLEAAGKKDGQHEDEKERDGESVDETSTQAPIGHLQQIEESGPVEDPGQRTDAAQSTAIVLR